MTNAIDASLGNRGYSPQHCDATVPHFLRGADHVHRSKKYSCEHQIELDKHAATLYILRRCARRKRDSSFVGSLVQEQKNSAICGATSKGEATRIAETDAGAGAGEGVRTGLGQKAVERCHVGRCASIFTGRDVSDFLDEKSEGLLKVRACERFQPTGGLPRSGARSVCTPA